MKKILIAIDCTSFAKEVALAGKEFAKQYPGAEVAFMHALLQPDYYSSAQYAPILGFNEYYNKELSELLDGSALQDAVQDFMQSLKEDLSFSDAEIIIQPGNPEKTILEVANERNADILIIGKQNQASTNKNRIGHITETILKNATIPVYVVPSHLE